MSQNTSLFPTRLRVLSDEAMRTPPWPELAAYIDSLNEEYQRFNALIREQRIGRAVPMESRPKARPGV